jgi:hypothetical protein
MSRGYEIRLEVSGVVPHKGPAIVAALSPLWDWSGGLKCGDNTISAASMDDLPWGITEEVKMEEICRAIWTANSAYCDIAIEFLAFDPELAWELKREDYERIMKESEETK